MFKGKSILGLIAIVLIMFGVYVFTYVNSERTIEITVDDKERVTQTSSDGKVESKYLVYCEDRVLENTDDLVYFKFNSSEVYNELEEKDEYKVRIVGWRVTFLSWYPNIIEVNNEKTK